MDLHLENKVALVTGSAKRVGRAIALRLAQAGCRIAVHYRSSGADAQATIESCRSMGVEAEGFSADLEDPQAALPIPTGDQSQEWFEAAPGRDPLAIADALGRPVAILRLGARLPGTAQGPDADFLFGCPPWVYQMQPGRAQSTVRPPETVPTPPAARQKEPPA